MIFKNPYRQHRLLDNRYMHLYSSDLGKRYVVTEIPIPVTGEVEFVQESIQEKRVKEVELMRAVLHRFLDSRGMNQRARGEEAEEELETVISAYERTTGVNRIELYRYYDIWNQAQRALSMKYRAVNPQSYHSHNETYNSLMQEEALLADRLAMLERHYINTGQPVQSEVGILQA